MLRTARLLSLHTAVLFAAAADAGAAAAPAPAPEKPPVLKQNGIKRPDSGTITGNLWDIADRISAEQKRPALRKEVVDEYLKLPGANQATANTQYARWVTYHGASDALRKVRDKMTADAKAAKQAEAKQKADAAAAEKQAKEKAAADAKAAKEAEAKRKADEKAAAAAKKQADAEAKKTAAKPAAAGGK